MENSFLINFGFDKKIIDLIIENNSLVLYQSLLYNEEQCIKIIIYLRKIGISCIKDLLIYRIDLFFKTYEEVLKIFNNVSKDLILEINEDYTLIDEIIKNK